LNTENIESISLGLRDVTDWKKVATVVTDAFPDLEAASFAELDKVYYQNSVDWLNTQFHVVQIIILSIVLLGIFNSISSAILERKQEIGNLRANGESVLNVMQLFIFEGSFLGIFGGSLGLILTYILVKGFIDQGILMPPGPGFTREFYISFSFNLRMALITLMLSTASAIIASILAGMRVAKMPIAKALRS
jgi:putative ABC transport system permease protein